MVPQCLLISEPTKDQTSCIELPTIWYIHLLTPLYDRTRLSPTRRFQLLCFSGAILPLLHDEWTIVTLCCAQTAVEQHCLRSDVRFCLVVLDLHSIGMTAEHILGVFQHQ